MQLLKLYILGTLGVPIVLGAPTGSKTVAGTNHPHSLHQCIGSSRLTRFLDPSKRGTAWLYSYIGKDAEGTEAKQAEKRGTAWLYSYIGKDAGDAQQDKTTE